MINNAIITVHKTKFNFHFGMGFLGELLDDLDTDIEGVMEKVNKNPFKMIPIIMFGAAKYGFERKDEECKYTLYDFIDFIDADGGIQAKSVQKFLEAFTNSVIKDVPKEEGTAKKIKAPKKS
jgi:hypothetical protein